MTMHPIGVHVGPGLTAENELDDGGPLARAAEMDADGVQVFLTDPQSYKSPKPRPDADALLQSDVMVFVHAPYMLNVASTNNRIRIPGRKLLAEHAQAAAAIGARGMVVHGGHVLAEDDPAVGVDNWRKTFTYQAEERRLPAPAAHREHGRRRQRDGAGARRDRAALGGDRRVRRRVRARHLPRLGGRLGPHDRRRRPARDHRAGGPRAPQQQPGPAGSSRDRHAPLAGGEIPLELLVEVARAADCPIILETPGDAAAHAEEIQLLRASDDLRTVLPHLTGSSLTVDAEVGPLTIR